MPVRYPPASLYLYVCVRACVVCVCAAVFPRKDNDDAVAFGMTFARMLERVLVLGEQPEVSVRAIAQQLKGNTSSGGAEAKPNPNDRWFAHALGKMDEWRCRPPFDVTLEIGQACDFPFHILTAPHFLLHRAAVSGVGGAGYAGAVGDSGGECGNSSSRTTRTGSSSAVADSTASDSSLEWTFVDSIRETILLGGENADRGSFVGSLVAAAAVAAGAQDPLAAIPLTWRNQTTRWAELLAVAESIVDGGHASSFSSSYSASSPSSSSSSSSALPTASSSSDHSALQLDMARRLTAPHGRSSDSTSTRAGSTSGTSSTTSSRTNDVNRQRLRGPGLGNAPGCIGHGNSTTSNATRPPSHPDDSACGRM